MENLNIKPDKIYEEAGQNNRQFLNWREKILAGYITVIAGLSVAFSNSQSPLKHIIILIGAILVSIVFWIFDIRNRQLFWTCQHAGKLLERDTNGPYKLLEELRFNNKTLSRLTHGLAVNILVSGIITGSIGGFLLKMVQLVKGTSPSEWLRSDCHLIIFSISMVFLFLIFIIIFESVGDKQRNEQQLKNGCQTNNS